MHLKIDVWSRDATKFLRQRRDTVTNSLNEEEKALWNDIEPTLKQHPRLAEAIRGISCFPDFGQADDADVRAAQLLPTTSKNAGLKCEVIGARAACSKRATLSGHASAIRRMLEIAGAKEGDTLETYLIGDSPGLYAKAAAEVSATSLAAYVKSVLWGIDQRVFNLTMDQIDATRPFWFNLFDANKEDAVKARAEMLKNSTLLDYEDILDQADQWLAASRNSKARQLLDLVLHLLRQSNMRAAFGTLNLVCATQQEIRNQRDFNFILVDGDKNITVVLDRYKTSDKLGRISTQISREVSD